jgi:hypothetical protein
MFLSTPNCRALGSRSCDHRMQHGRICRMRLGIVEMLHWDQKTPLSALFCSIAAIYKGDMQRRISSPPRSEAQCDGSRRWSPDIDDPANPIPNKKVSRELRHILLTRFFWAPMSSRGIARILRGSEWPQWILMPRPWHPRDFHPTDQICPGRKFRRRAFWRGAAQLRGHPIAFQGPHLSVSSASWYPTTRCPNRYMIVCASSEHVFFQSATDPAFCKQSASSVSDFKFALSGIDVSVVLNIRNGQLPSDANHRAPSHSIACKYFLNFMWLLQLQIVQRVVSVGRSFGVCMYVKNDMSARASDTLICDMPSWWFTPVEKIMGDADDAKHQLSRKRAPSSKFLATGERLVRI